MTKASKTNAAAQRRRTAKEAISENFGENVAKAALSTRAATTTNKERVNGYAVLVDNQQVAYLRVEETAKGAKFLLNTGKRVDVVELDNQTMRSRALEIIPEASVIEAAKVLANPPYDGVIISERSKKLLEQILTDKKLEETEMTTKAAKKNTKSASTSAAHAKSGSTRSAESIVKLNKMAKEGELPKQALTILEVLKAAGKLSIAELQKKMASKIESKQSMAALWGFYRSRLVKGGFVTVAPAA